MNPTVVHVVRPYSNEQEYLAAEAWSIEARSMLLIDVAPLPPDTAVLFDVALAEGQKPIRAEGRVVGPVLAQGLRPGGLKVRFKRFGAATKAFIERAVAAKSPRAEPERPSQSDAEQPSAPDAERPSSVDLERPSMTELERPSLGDVARPSMTELETASVPLPAPADPALASGLRERVPGPIAAPANREELLARLRGRTRTG